MQNKEEKPYIHGIRCDVKNCIHHNKECHCTSKEIKVGPSFASCSSDTVCATFQEQK